MKNESSPILQNLHLLIDTEASAAVVSPIAAMIQNLLAEKGITPADTEYPFGKLLRTLSHFQEHCGAPAALPFVGEPWLVRKSIYCELVLTDFARNHFIELKNPSVYSGERIPKGELKHEMWLVDASTNSVTVMVPPSPSTPLRVFNLKRVGAPDKLTGDITAALRPLNTPATKKDARPPNLLAVHSSEPEGLVTRELKDGDISVINIGYLGRSGSLTSARIIPQHQKLLVKALTDFHICMTRLAPKQLHDVGLVIDRGVITATKGGVAMDIDAVLAELDQSIIDLWDHISVLDKYCRDDFIALCPEDCQRIYQAANENPLLVCAALVETVSAFTQPETAAAIRRALINSIMSSHIDFNSMREMIFKQLMPHSLNNIQKKACIFNVLSEQSSERITVAFPCRSVRRHRAYVAVSSRTQSFMLGTYDNTAMGNQNPLGREIIPAIYRLTYETDPLTRPVNMVYLAAGLPEAGLMALEKAAVGAKEVIVTPIGPVIFEKLASANPNSTRNQSLFDHVVHTQDVCTALSLLGEFFAVDRKSIQVVSSKEDLVEQIRSQSIRNAFS